MSARSVPVGRSTGRPMRDTRRRSGGLRIGPSGGGCGGPRRAARGEWAAAGARVSSCRCPMADGGQSGQGGAAGSGPAGRSTGKLSRRARGGGRAGCGSDPAAEGEAGRVGVCRAVCSGMRGASLRGRLARPERARLGGMADRPRVRRVCRRRRRQPSSASRGTRSRPTRSEASGARSAQVPGG